MARAAFRFYGPLNDFLPPARRGRTFDATCAPDATVKHMVEALGVPHTEIELLLVDGQPAGFAHLLRDGERVAVYPGFESLDVGELARLREPVPGPPRFVADAHFGGLARLLRMAGFDTLYDNCFRDAEIEALAARGGRIVLTRDRELLKRRGIVRGCYLRARDSVGQLQEVFDRLGLARHASPFSLCMECNAALEAVDKPAVLDRLPPKVRERHQHFTFCRRCDRVYWPGSHWQRMRGLIDALLRRGA
ncbi:MAG TPA: Mut7-C RNAse domain-containing protein [Rhodocyclaceae bacterium]|nr:Mut7-C ubiquitin/RNAse domain-containing protein [Rhodocyclaceae bacterium]HNA03721.1 Mut7-C RNAse domain-containing protein [Rhodocyclaceae bacterium]